MSDPPGAAPIIISAMLGAGDFARFDALRRAHFPPERNQLSAHLTLFHHLNPAWAAEITDLLAAQTRQRPPPVATVAGVTSLGRGVAFRIVSRDLDDVRAFIADRFAQDLTPQDAAPWRAHITVQNKVAPAQAAALKAALEADFRPEPLLITGLAAWWYVGGPWAPLSRHLFRGR